MKLERRTIPGTEVRIDEGENGPELVGYAAVFDSYSVDLGGFREKIKPGTFRKTIAEADIRGLINHDSNLLFARSKAGKGSLQLKEDETGLRYSTILDTETSYVADLVRSIQRGDISGNSFAFRTIKDKWNEDLSERELLEVQLYDVGPVTYPAYPDTSLDLRSALKENIDLDSLEMLLFKQSRGLELKDADLELLNQSLQYLSGLRKEPEKAEPEGNVIGQIEVVMKVEAVSDRVRALRQQYLRNRYDISRAA